MHRTFRALAGAFLLFASAAGAADGPSDTVVPAGQGAVLLTVTVDYPTMANENALMPGLIPELTVEAVGVAGKPLRFVLPKRLTGLQSARAYAGSLPPGRYRIHDLMGSNCRWLCGKGGLSMPKAGDLPEFTVEDGRLAWLGNVYVSALSPVPPAKAWTVRWAWTDAPDPVLARRLLAGVYPEFASAGLGDRLGGGWDPATAPALDAAMARERIRATASGLFEPSPDGADGFFFGAQNGVVKRWSRSEGLHLLDTGLPYVLRSVVRAQDGGLLVGGEAGTLLYSPDAGRTWQDASAGLPWGVVVQAKAIGGDELVFSLLSGDTVRLYRGRVGPGPWAQVGEWTMEFATWTGLPGMWPELQLQGRRVALTLPSKRGIFLDLDSGETHAITPPGSIATFVYSADGVMRCTCFRSIAANPWESRDLGRTWTDSPLDRWMHMPAFADAQRAFSFKGAMFSEKKRGVMVSADGGQTWALKPGPPGGIFWKPAWSADGQLMLLWGVVIRDGNAHEAAHWSVDAGDTWTALPAQGTWRHRELVAPPAPVLVAPPPPPAAAAGGAR